MRSFRFPRSSFIWLVAALALLVLVAGCASRGDGTAVGSSGEAAASAVESVATTAPIVAPTAAEAADGHDHDDDQDHAGTSADDDDHDDDHDHDEASADDDDHDDDHDHAEASAADDDDDHDHDEASAADDDDHDHVEASADNDDQDDAVEIDVANADYLGTYTLIDDSFGTLVTVRVDGSTRTIESNTLPNHETGDFPNSGNPNTISAQDRSWTLTTEPTYTGQAQTVREPGVALNGVKFEPGTAETIECSSGETYRIEGLQDMFDLGMDFNNAHVQPTGEYHYHGVSDLLVDAFTNDADLMLVGFAADGHLMYYSKSNSYEPSYVLADEARTGTDCTYRGTAVDLSGTAADGTYVSDWQYVEGQGDLDECNGTVIGDEYAYVITEQYPYISRCLMGEFTEAGPGGGGAQPPGGQAPVGGAPDLHDAAAALGLTETELQQLLGGPPPDVAAAASTLDMTEDELSTVLAEYGVAPPAP